MDSELHPEIEWGGWMACLQQVAGLVETHAAAQEAGEDDSRRPGQAGVATDQGGLLGAAAEELLENPDRIVDLLVRDELAVEQAELEHHDAGNPRYGLVGAVEHQAEAGVALQELLGVPERAEVQLVEDAGRWVGGRDQGCHSPDSRPWQVSCQRCWTQCWAQCQPRARPLIS